ncbi:MAG: 16S rRNA (cytidine(1402)-2'-O)-methyltransferase [Candidatus Portnoybacteria bacterium]|nr:16S rRNA (cytidine(1402)-2'-O)-methyltransferase [Candidatus Portnoybacteria bacterium]
MTSISSLYLIATPIGNLEDITLRALRVLKEVDWIVAEDTRQTKKLLLRYHIEKPILSFHEHTSPQKLQEIGEFLLMGKNFAYVVDAGSPALSDPGARLVDEIIKQAGARVSIVPIPGPSALTALLSVAGIRTERFLFLGFLPKKKGRRNIIEEIVHSPYPVVFFESPYRIIKTLQDLQGRGDFYAVVGRELTKKFETIYRGSIAEVLEQLEKDKVKGEFTVVIKRMATM